MAKYLRPVRLGPVVLVVLGEEILDGGLDSTGGIPDHTL